MNHKIEIIDVLGSEMETFLFYPNDITAAQPAPGLILIQHIPVGHAGIENDTFTLETASRLAQNGYVVAVPFIFHWWPKSEDIQLKRSRSRDDWMVADMQAAYERLRRDDYVSEDIGIVGHCWGGRGAWLGACHLRGLKACAMFYGGRIQQPLGEGLQAPISLAANIQCPVAGFYGLDDKSPSPDDVQEYEEALGNAGISYEFHRYENAGHAFQNFPMPERYNEKASEDAWKKLLAFLEQNLKG
ncbi:MAG: dienelactone hydrolase family protein [Gammaproteobacteria bacterium]|nr:dienelactone hydrolase family protein [Gammaproteobacteria bacterium]